MSKLTLTVDPEVVKQAKIYAASRQQSLSKLVENYFRSLSHEESAEKTELTGVVAELSGILDEEELQQGNSYEDYLHKKYQ